MKAWLTNIVKLTPLWLFLLAPFLLFPSPTRALALLGLPLLWGAQKLTRGYFVRRTPLDWPILLMLLMVLVSLYATFDLVFSLSKLSGILFHIVIFYAVVETVQTKAGLSRSLILYFLLGLGVAGLGLIGTDWLFKIELLNKITRRLPLLIQGLPGAEPGIGPNQLAGTLLWFFPLPLSLLWAKRKHRDEASTDLSLRPIFLWVILGATGSTFVLTQSRGGWIGGVVALAFLGAILSKHIRWLVVLGAGVAVIAANLIGWSTVGELLVSDATEAMVGNMGSLGFRQEVWRVALWGVADFPFTGMGLGTFREVARVLYPLNVSPTYDIAHAHNHFLQTALDLGIAGLVAYMALWLGAAYLLFQTIRQTPDPFLKAVALGVSSCLVGYFIYGLSDAVALGAKPGLFLWWLLAFSVGVYQQATLSNLPKPQSQSPHRPGRDKSRQGEVPAGGSSGRGNSKL